MWYDAEEYDGAEEFVLDELPDDSQASKISENNLVGTPSTSTSETSRLNLGSASESESSDSEVESEPLEETSESVAPDGVPVTSKDMPIVRRTQLPSPPVGDEGSLFAVLKKNVGKVRKTDVVSILSSRLARISVL